MKLLSWDAHNINDGTNYEAVIEAGVYGLPTVDPVMGSREGTWPVLSGLNRPGKIINFDVYIRNTPIATYQKQLAQWFDPDDQEPKRLVGEDLAGTNDRFVMGICVQLVEVPFSAGLHYVVSIQVDGDVFWREVSPTVASVWSVTATGQTKVVNNGGEMDAYPVIEIEPTSGKTGAYLYKRWIPVRWNSDEFSGGLYPVDITQNGLDTASLTTAKMQADGDDLRVFVAGSEVDRWLEGMDTSTTQVWVNLVFQAKQEVTLNGAHNNSITTITVNEDISGFPTSGILHVDAETITYTEKDDSQKQFIGCTRGAKGTSAAAHSDNAVIWWVQHDIWIKYGNSGASTPTLDPDYAPLFELSSNNNSWDYNDFYDSARSTRPGAWKKVDYTPIGGTDFYGGNRDTVADPFEELGQAHRLSGAISFWYANNPCGISAANFVNGEIYQEDTNASVWSWKIESSEGGSVWDFEYNLGTPPAASTWTAWSRNETLAALAQYVRIWWYTNPGIGKDCCECSDVTLTITNGPTGTAGTELTNYDLDVTITNNTTGQAVQVTYSMQLNEDLEVDTDEKTVILLNDNSNQFQALGILGGVRRDWLPLQPGNNTLQFDDVGTGNVSVSLEWFERFYQ